MKTRLIAILVLVALMLTLFAGCNEKPSMLTDEEAQKIALEAADLADMGLSAHSHFSIVDGVPQYEVHFSLNDLSYTYVIHARTGEVLSSK